MYFVSDRFLESLLEDDIPYGDETTSLLAWDDAWGTLTAKSKTEGVVSGLTLAARLLRRMGSTVEEVIRDGDRVSPGTTLLRATGSAQALHSAYKTAQCVMEYCSGISRRVDAMRVAAQSVNPQCQVALTRKHFPGTKTLALYAVRVAGGSIHRLGLSDSILLFDQHRVFMADPTHAIRAIKAKSPERKVAVEVASDTEALQFLDAGADLIQCERFEVASLSRLVQRVHHDYPHARVLATGGIRADNAQAYAATGVDALVTSWPYYGAPADISMVFSAHHVVD